VRGADTEVPIVLDGYADEVRHGVFNFLASSASLSPEGASSANEIAAPLIAARRKSANVA
jgi:hypothetical protein